MKNKLNNPYNLFFYFQRYKNLINIFSSQKLQPLEELKICEIGFGSAQILVDFINWGILPENIYGIEINHDRFLCGKKKIPTAQLIKGSADNLPWENNSFDIVIQATLFTSLLDKKNRLKAACEMIRVLKSEGFIIWYDFIYNNPWNKNVIGMNRKEISRLFPKADITLKRVTLFPQLGRIISPISISLSYFLENLPFFCTHYIGVIEPYKV